MTRQRAINTELALAAIYAVLNANGIMGWEEWSAAAVDGLWF